jgi:hypothetical protein
VMALSMARRLSARLRMSTVRAALVNLCSTCAGGGRAVGWGSAPGCRLVACQACLPPGLLPSGLLPSGLLTVRAACRQGCWLPGLLLPGRKAGAR